MNKNAVCEREYDFALIVSGVHELNEAVENALFDAGCDDATLSIQYGQLYMEFSRVAPSLLDAIVSAINAIEAAGIGAEVERVDECDLVTQADIARRIDRSRQQVHQYITGQRGPGGFPAPACYVTEKAPLWAWCAVSYWLVQNNMIKPEEFQEAEVIALVNNALECRNQRKLNPELADKIARALEPAAG